MTKTNHLKNESEVNEMFTRVAPNYDKLNNIISLGTQKLWRKKLLAGLEFKPGIKALDVCCGTGDLAIALANRLPQGRVTGVDFNAAMLKIAEQKAKTIPNLILINGDAMDLPLEDESFDIVTIGFGLRNVPDADKALSEIYRVLKPGGQLGVLEMSQPTNSLIRVGWKAYFKAFPYLANLSGGAKEQLAILTRFAIAELVAESSAQGAVPVFIDDALGSTDPEGPILWSLPTWLICRSLP